MKLSEAIRLGSMMKPQHYGSGYGMVGDQQASCAFFAAIDSMGGIDGSCSHVVPAGTRYSAEARAVEVTREEERVFLAPPEWREITHKQQTCPQCNLETFGLYVISDHLNDDHRWTRERIADWVETVENAQEAVSWEALEMAGKVSTQKRAAKSWLLDGID